jgi:multidrug resistance protein
MIRRLLPILGITFIDILGFSMLIPILPYFVTHFGAAPFAVGLLFATFSLCQLIAGPIWGNLSDRLGRKAVLIISQIGATIGWAMLAFAGNLMWVFIARIVEGASGGNIGVTQAYAADLVEPRERSRAFGYIGATFAAGMVFGPLGGAVLFSRFGYPAPFLAAAGLQFITLILTIVLLPESRKVGVDEEHVGMREILRTFGKPHVRPYLVQKLFLSLGLYGWFAVIALFLKGQLNFSLQQLDLFMSGFAVLNIFGNTLLVGKASGRFGDRGMSNLGLVALTLSFAIIPFVHSVWMMAIAVILFSLGMAMANTGITGLISAASSNREQGTVLGVTSSLDSVSGIVSPPISTGLLTAYGSPFAGLDSFLMTGTSLILGLIAGRNEREGTRPTSSIAGIAESVAVGAAEEG